MSHFAVIVIGENVDEQMAPYAEQDYDEKYAEFHDVEDESMQEYMNNLTDLVVLSDGTLHHKCAERFRNRDGNIFSSDHIPYVYPADSMIRKGKFTELYDNFEDFMSGWSSYEARDEKTGRYGYWHNPKAKWDWYTVGGRWMGNFKLKSGATGEVGKSGAFDNYAKSGWADSLRLCDIDIKGMKESAKKEANDFYDKLEGVLNGREIPSWDAIYKKHNENAAAAREEYHSNEVVQDLNKAQIYVMGDLFETFGPNREAYVQRSINNVMVSYAFVKDGKWYEKGQMGWFGMSDDKMTQEEWNEQFWQMIATLDPQVKLTLVDCHI